MTTREWLEQNMANHPDQNALIAACIAAVGCTRDNVTRHLKRIRDDAAESVRNAVPAAGPTSAAAPGVDGFKRLYDPDHMIPEKIRAVVNGTLMARSWMYEDEFRTETGLSKSDFYKYRGSPEFSEMRIRAKDPCTKQEVYVWAHPSIAQEIRKIAVKL